MRVVLQRVERAEVSVDGRVVGAIGHGLVALVGIGAHDTPEVARRLADKTVALRVFARDDRPFDLSLAQVDGALLCISQFTLLASMRRGNRPSWAAAAPGADAEPLVEAYAAGVAGHGIPVARGAFGAHMRVQLVNDGPVTLVLDSAEILAG